MKIKEDNNSTLHSAHSRYQEHAPEYEKKNLNRNQNI